MKILVVRGENLTSLSSKFEVDFTKEPLASAGIFAITGPTGAGKSTLLDAMCIALYGTSPRINKVDKRSEITDVQELVIKEHDCRNFLRRGSIRGNAEVEFKALDGKVYRASWSVKRARNKSNGKIQDAERTLCNITDNTIIETGKKEFSEKISELIGLTYEQFTRAVLLAQGEFSTFLKATAKDKAEILEKLTGTDIYSKISARIYESHKAAENDYKLVAERIKDIVLLADEEKEQLIKESKELYNELQRGEQQSKLLENRKAWIEQHSTLTDNAKKSGEECLAARESLAAAKESADRLALIDSVQDIRDTYMSALEAHKNKPRYQKQLEEEKAQLKRAEEELATAQKEVAEKSEMQETLNRKWLGMQPKIKEAHTIEADCRNTSNRLKDIEKENAKLLSSLESARKDTSLITASITDGEKLLDEIAKWFKEHEAYSTLIARCDTIIANIKDIAATRKSISARVKLLGEAERLLAAEEKNLKECEKEAEELGRMLPEEIAALRKRLVEGEPCPVCGSCHHPISDIEEKTLKEEALIKAKQAVQAQIENRRKSIEEGKISINSHKAYIESLEESLRNSEERNREMLQPLQGVVTVPDENFAKDLEEVVKTWNGNIALQNETTAAQAVNRSRLEATGERIKELVADSSEKEKAATKCKEELEAKGKKIIELIGENRSAEEVEKEFCDGIAQINGEVTRAIEKRNGIMVTREKISGSIAQMTKTLADVEARLTVAQEEIAVFLSKREDSLTMEQLHALFATGSDEVARLRKAIDTLRSNLLKAEATHKERLQAVEEHRKSPHKPAEEENIADIEKEIEEIGTRNKSLLDKMGEANSKLKLNDENRKLHEQYMLEYKENMTVLENWSILNDTFGSATGDKFKIIAQGYTLDILLEYANAHLKEISHRYKLARTSIDSLSIKVIDADMMNEERSVHSLSGGETFLVSLALALALSSLSSNRMSIESLFIDEGFGALDNETLRTAMEALEKLQGLGRKVGVISHLQEIIERIPVKIKVEKEQEGRSKLRIEVS